MSQTINPFGSATISPLRVDDNQSPGIILEEGRSSHNENSIPSTNNNDNQSRSKGANSADLSSLDPQPGGRSSFLSRGSIHEDSSIFLKQLEKQPKQSLADHEHDVYTRMLLVRELKMPQTYNDKEDKDIKVATDLFHLYDTKSLKTKEVDLSHLSPNLVNCCIIHDGDNGDVLVTGTVEVDADPLDIIAYQMDYNSKGAIAVREREGSS